MHQKFSRVFLLFLIRLAVGVSYQKLFDPCNRNDIKCLSEATEDFLEKTANGLPDYDIKAIEPLIIPELKVVVNDGMTFEFTNINITGLKNQQISDFLMDTANKLVVLKTKAVLNIGGDLKITFTKKNKEFTGTYTASATAIGCSEYGYSLIEKSDEYYFEVSPEINTCQIIGEPVVTIDDVLQKALNNDSDAKRMKPEYDTIKVSLKKKTICTIVETAYITVIHNLRALAKVFPASAFFNNV